jgi:hypothetical protein
MLSTARCKHCLGELQLAADQVEIGKDIECPWCGKVSVISVQPRKSGEPITPAYFQNKPKPKPIPPRQYLRAVRENTCYETLRSVIRFIFALGYLVLAGGALFAIFLGFTGVQTFLVALGIIAAGALLAIVGVATHQALLLLIDIADAIIEQGARQGEMAEP